MIFFPRSQYKIILSRENIFMLSVLFVSHRGWIEQTELKGIDYVLKGFDTSIVEGAIKVRGGRQELGKPVRKG